MTRFSPAPLYPIVDVSVGDFRKARGLAEAFFEAGLPISGFAVFLAVVFAISVGLIAGLYPSLRASRLTPVEALAG